MATNNPQGHNQHTEGSGSSGTRGGSPEQHAKAGAQSHKNTQGGGNGGAGESGGTRGGSHEQHVKAGQQSHKNSR